MRQAIVTFTDDEYVQGIGDLTLQIDSIRPLDTMPGWALVGGVTVDGGAITGKYRYIWVSISVLRTHLLAP